MTDTVILSLSCPTCKKIVAWTEQFPYRPFCSKRCQQIDFGDWVLEKNAIPAEEMDFSAEDLDDFSPQ